MLASFFIPFVTTLFAEFFDKSQLSLILLATRSKNSLLLIPGTLAAFAIVDGVAVLFGGAIAHIIPLPLVRIFSGLVFALFGIWMLISSKATQLEHKPQPGHPLLASFLLVFLAEWGDKTQVTAFLLAAQYQPLAAFFGMMLAFLILSCITIFLGRMITRRLNTALLSKLGGLLFLLIGLRFVLTG